MTALQCSALIDEASKEDFVEEIKEEYEEVRDEHYDSLKVRNINLRSIDCYVSFFAKIYSAPKVCWKRFSHGNVSQSVIG